MKIYKDSEGLHVLIGVPNNEMIMQDVYIEKILVDGKKYASSSDGIVMTNITKILVDEKNNYSLIEWEKGDILLTTNPITIYLRKRDK